MTKTPVDYSERPNKSLVRSKILNIIEEQFEPHHEEPESISYITFSGYRFIDSIEFYKRFSIRSIFSIEYKDSLFRRAKFNMPYEFIDITNGRIVDFIANKGTRVVNTNKIVFLDYESKLNDVIVSDIEALVASGFFNRDCLLFITFNITYRKFYHDKLTPIVKELVPEDIKSEGAYKNWLDENFSYFILDKVQKKFGTQKRIREVLKAFYSDGAKMAIFGYLIKQNDGAEKLLESIKSEEFSLPVLTFLEENYLRNNLLSGEPGNIANVLGLTDQDVSDFIHYA